MNYDIVDEINQEKDHACYYCQNTTRGRIVQCAHKGCREYFCNNTTFNQATGSHIYHHLTIRDHNRIKITSIMKCSCGTKNSFELNFKKAPNNKLIIKCRTCTLSSLSKNPQERWESFFTENSLSSELVKSAKDNNRVSYKEIYDLEMELSKGMIRNPFKSQEIVKKAKLTYSSLAEYLSVFRTLHSLEKEHEIESNDNQSMTVVVPTWSENFKKFTFLSQEERTLFKPRDELVLTAEYFKTTAIITGINKGGLVTVELSEEAGNPSIKKIQIQIIYNDCSFKRIEDAFDKIHELNETMRSAVLGDNVIDKKFKVYEVEDYSVAGLPSLNCSQNLAVRRALESPIFLIQGPPGTGKTVASASIVYHLSKNLNQSCPQLESLMKKSACVSTKVLKVESERDLRMRLKEHFLVINQPFDENIEDRLDLYIAESQQWIEKYKQKQDIINVKIDSIQTAAKLQNRPIKKVLVCAPSNVAVDNLANKISKTGLNVIRFFSKYKQVSDQCNNQLNFYTRFLEALKDPENQRLRDLHGKLQRNRLSKTEHTEYKSLELTVRQKILEPVEVVCCTCSGAFDWRLNILSFEKVLVDEACQAKEPEMLLPMLLDCDQLIMVGDQMQLGPVVKSDVAEKAGMGTSLFERLIKLKFESCMLDIQFRMHPDIAGIPNKLFYDGRINSGISAEDRVQHIENFKWPGASPVFFYHIPYKEETSTTGKSFVNQGEVIAIKEIIKRLGFGVEIGVITFYDAQKVLLGRFLNSLEDGFDVEIASVDSFQGREKDYIILSCVRSNKNLGIGFLWNFRRLNVAITRAKYGLIICGNAETLVKSDAWNEIIKILKRKQLIFQGSLDNLVIMNPNVNRSCGGKFMSSYSYENDSDEEEPDSFEEYSDDNSDEVFYQFMHPEVHNPDPWYDDAIIDPDNLNSSFDYENYLLEELYFGKASE